MQTHCLACTSTRLKVIYDGKLRSGSWGKQTVENRQVQCCAECGLAWLAVFPKCEDFYNSGSYREDYNDSVDVNNYLRQHDQEQTPRLARIGAESFREKRVLDYGCGGGSFLDLVRGLASQTCAIEPCTPFHSSLRERGHQVYGKGKDAVKDLRSTIDLLTSFVVIEHVEDPLEYLIHVRELLKPGGRAFIETDNFNQLLVKVGGEEFKSFNFRTAHLWYFTENSLAKLAERAGLSVVLKGYRQVYDLSNLICWLSEHAPTGVGKLPFFDENLNTLWRKSLETQGLADIIWFELQRPL